MHKSGSGDSSTYQLSQHYLSTDKWSRTQCSKKGSKPPK